MATDRKPEDIKVGVSEGWKPLSNAKLWHYFRDGKSLCGKWMTLSMRDVEQGNDNSPDNCKACKDKLAKGAKP